MTLNTFEAVNTSAPLWIASRLYLVPLDQSKRLFLLYPTQVDRLEYLPAPIEKLGLIGKHNEVRIGRT